MKYYEIKDFGKGLWGFLFKGRVEYTGNMDECYAFGLVFLGSRCENLESKLEETK